MAPLRHLLATAFFLTAAVSAAQTSPPTEKCDFNGARLDAPLRLVNGSASAPYYFACQKRPGSACIQGSVPSGQVVSVDREQAGWSCIAADGTSGWVENSHLQQIPADPRPALTDWQGWWQKGTPVPNQKGDRLLLTPGTHPGSLRVSGRAYWYGINDVVLFGQINGQAAAIGNHLHVIEVNAGKPTACVLDLTLITAGTQPQMQGSDNMGCGGMNVNFRGTWRKFTPASTDPAR